MSIRGHASRWKALLLLVGLFLPISLAYAQSNFDWRQAAGTTLTVELNHHPYTEAILARIPVFEELTGITVRHTITPEDVYFDRITVALFGRSGSPDVFMTGVYQMWDYAAAGFMEPLDRFINDPTLTHPDYNPEDFFDGVWAGGRWSLRVGDPSGTGPQWVVPLGFETNILAYNKRLFEERGLKPPTTLDELYELAVYLREWAGPGSYGLAVRGTRSWATIHPGFMTIFASAGARDFVVEGNRLVSALNSPEAIALTERWAETVRDGGPLAWATYTWYEASAALGAGRAAMLFDADIVAYFQNFPGVSAESGNIAFAPPPVANPGDPLASNVWIWTLGMNSSSVNQTAAWLFMQYFTSKEHQLWGAVNARVVNPVRRSVWANPDFIDNVAGATGYYETFQVVAPIAEIAFTPQPFFFQTTTEWAGTLQDIVLRGVPADVALNDLATRINRTVARIRIE